MKWLNDVRIVLLAAATAALVPLHAANAVESPIGFKLYTRDITVSADGTYIETSHVELYAKNDSAAQKAAQQELPYDAASQDLDVVEAYTLKADGTKLPVAASAIYVQAQQGAKNVPIDDRKQKLVVFPNVAAGDLVVYTAKLTAKRAFFPGYFTLSDAAPRTVSFQEARVTVTAPKGMPLKVESHGVDFAKEEGDSTTTYRWTYKAPDALVEDNAQLASLEVNPRYFASSFKDYDELGRAYASMTAPLIAVTPKVQAQADSLTAGISDRRQQAEKIYQWVSSHITYVGIELGDGAIEPRSADTVLANGYGDSRDHTVIFAALLKAKGIDNEIALINDQNGYTLSEVAALGELNHAIVWLPEFSFYADTSLGMAPFGLIAVQEYGKPAVHAVATGQALRRTPVMPAGATSISVKTATKMDAEGKLTGETKTSATGPAAIFLRLYGIEILSRGPESAAAAQLQSLGYDGGTGTFELASPTEFGADYSITGRYEVPAKPELVSGVAFDLFGGLRLFSTTGDFLMGSLWNYKLTPDDKTPCYSGHTEEELSLELPEGKHLEKLPSDASVVDKHVEFTAHWSQDGQTVRVKRDFKVSIDQAICDGDLRKEAAKALAAIRNSFDIAQLTLVDD